ncbi:MAG: hypothetical protein PHP52_02320 [Bacteroidales bacterium]|jgi:hypothetical protein|nr:hypothetical protein [Bacteroidales bacterium]MDD4216275.1 hypothetical protein [Bacteroidales bacterium]MDY0141576.1 hypothetical protein [Bacteroidales bacterium]
MKNTFLFLVIILVSSVTTNAQMQLNLLNGNQIKLESYVFHNHENYMDYSFINKKGKTKQSYADLNKVYSISLNGKDTVLYQQIIEDEYTVDEMSRIVMARQYSLKEYKPWWAFASGMLVGCGSMFLPLNGTTKLLIPIIYTTGMAFVRPANSYIRKNHETEMYDDLFVYGYKSTGRKKIFKNTTLGVLGGIFVSGIVWSTLYFTSEN